MKQTARQIVSRHLQAIMLALAGVPGIYFHSLFGSRSWRAGVDLTGRNRTINRQKLDLAAFESELTDEIALRNQVFQRYAQLIRARRSFSAFHPYGEQQILDCGAGIFALLRISPDGSQRALCLHNISDQSQRVMIDLKNASGLSGRLTDLITNRQINNPLRDALGLQPYQTLWLAMKE